MDERNEHPDDEHDLDRNTVVADGPPPGEVGTGDPVELAERDD